MKLQAVLKEAVAKLEGDLSSVKVQIGAETKVMQKLQQHAGKMNEQLEFVKGSMVAASDIRSAAARSLVAGCPHSWSLPSTSILREGTPHPESTKCAIPNAPLWSIIRALAL